MYIMEGVSSIKSPERTTTCPPPSAYFGGRGLTIRKLISCNYHWQKHGHTRLWIRQLEYLYRVTSFLQYILYNTKGIHVSDLCASVLSFWQRSVQSIYSRISSS
jgi:hypothetical protein